MLFHSVLFRPLPHSILTQNRIAWGSVSAAFRLLFLQVGCGRGGWPHSPHGIPRLQACAWGGGGFFTSPTRYGVFGLTLCEEERGVTYTKKLLLAPGSLANGYKSSECSTHCSNVCVDYLRFFSDDFLKVTWHFQGARLWGECIVCIALLFPTVRHCWCLWF